MTLCASRRREPAKSLMSSRALTICSLDRSHQLGSSNGAAQERHVGVAVIVDLFHVVLELVAGERGDALLLHLRIPVLARKVRQTQELLVIEIVAHEMGLDVEDELAGEGLRACQHQLGLAGLCRRDLEDIAVDVVHGEERSRHAAAGVHELPAAQAQPLAVRVGELVDPRLDLLLDGALRRRKILAVGNNLSGNRRCRRCRLSARNEALFSFTKPTAHLPPPLLVIEQRWSLPHEAARVFGHVRSVG
jgi:hypothetical protein